MVFFTPCHHQGKKADATANGAAANDSISTVNSLTVSLQLLNELGSRCFSGTSFYCILGVNRIMRFYYFVQNAGEINYPQKENSERQRHRYSQYRWQKCINTKRVCYKWKTFSSSETSSPLLSYFLSTCVYIYDNTYLKRMQCVLV